MTPQNGGYAVAAYVLAALVYLGYAAILAMRERSLRAKLDAPTEKRS
jgi:hypothetical protein